MPPPADSQVSSAACLVFAYNDLGYACLQALLEMGAPLAALFTHQDDPGEQPWWRSCAELARQHARPVHTVDRFDRATIDLVRGLAPAVIYSFMYRKLLPPSVLEIAPLGAYNMHPSKLPAYRGRSPINWVLVNGERETGVTLHHMVARADAGDIVAQRAVAIEDSDTALTLYRKLTAASVELIKQAHPAIVGGRAPRLSQDLSRGSYFGGRTPADGKIDWRWPARRIFNMVRAVTHPWPGAFCSAGERKLFIWQARIASERGIRGAPGAIVGGGAAGPEEIEVAAGEGSVALISVQWEGRREQSAQRALAAHPVAGALALS